MVLKRQMKYTVRAIISQPRDRLDRIKALFLSVCCLSQWAIGVSGQNLAAEFHSIAVNNDLMGGALVVFCQNGIRDNLVYGKSDMARNIPISTETKFRIASISKTITAMAVMQLVEQGLLDLDADVSTILGYNVRNPMYPASPITVRMLLSHTSSIIDGPTYGNFLQATLNNQPMPNLSDLLTVGGAYYTTAQFNNKTPGTYFNYSNINYVILGTLVEKISNQRFDVYVKEHICDPLGIDASFNVNDLTDINHVAVLYRKINGNWIPQADNYLGIQPVHDNISGYVPGTNGARFSPQGGFRCSAKDLATIFLVLMNGGSFDNKTLLSQASCDTMIANRWTYNGTNGNDYYGLFRSWGLGIHRVTNTPGKDIVLPGSSLMFGHAGEAYGLLSDAYFDTTRKVGLVFMTNGVGVGTKTNNYSAYYTVEQEIFHAVETYGHVDSCKQLLGSPEMLLAPTSLHPQPAADFLYLPEECTREGCVIQIFSSAGTLAKNVPVRSGATVIAVQDLPGGFYVLRVKNKYYRFIKA